VLPQHFTFQCQVREDNKELLQTYVQHTSKYITTSCNSSLLTDCKLNWPIAEHNDDIHTRNLIFCCKIDMIKRKLTCFKKPAPNALVTFSDPFTRSLEIADGSSGCSFRILRTSCNEITHIRSRTDPSMKLESYCCASQLNHLRHRSAMIRRELHGRQARR
jgi:hypothetical protein